MCNVRFTLIKSFTQMSTMTNSNKVYAYNYDNASVYNPGFNVNLIMLL